ncbi:heat shock protein Hsp20 [Ulvibacter sp. MAR_2010_11]|uniref:Hsp20/alpha crystallin family protein n=1 Tax=Ulvibacter sp. MAR_2010_11 TaxID=1250229 RepID=UPI000C2B84AF|nr:Hsp20/alpha crystallin family protein [Ulvibacter sp. MAR_2010_11]PKA83743.1 heat shock protein Hsp20 [Ulvibacter sp. MAR_2010_11]
MKVVKRNNVWFPSVFDDIFTQNRLDVPNYENFSIPAVNIKENFANFVLELAVPGLKKEDLTIEVEKDVLKISAESVKSEETANTDGEDTKFTRKEFNYNTFKRTFMLPDTVDVNAVNATYKDGILSIVLTKKKDKQEIKRMVEIS